MRSSFVFLISSCLVVACSTTSPQREPSAAPIMGETKPRTWRNPDFSGQGNAMGWQDDAFKTPEGLQRNVNFWIDIYSKFSTSEGVLHDSENLNIIYEKFDFTEINSRADMSSYAKEHAREKMVERTKKKYAEMLKMFQKVEDPSVLTPDEKRVWDMFVDINEPKRFIEAAKSNRLRFQLGQRDRMIQAIFYSGRYLDRFEQIFKEAGLPIELTRIVFVESSFNVLARSKVGASGLWQIMPSTLKLFGRRDPSIDLRNHPIESTRIAAKVFKMNYSMLESWPLAITGYNHGPTGVLKMTRKYKTREIAELVKNVQSRKSFGFASRNFYACFLAALEIERNAPKYLGNIWWSEPLAQEEIRTEAPILYKDVLRWFDGDDLKAQLFNPHLTKEARSLKIKIPAGVSIYVPVDRLKTAQEELSSNPNSRAARAE